MIDPQDPAAYRSAILDWSELAAPAHTEMLALYTRLIALRTTEPDLADPDLSKVRVDYDEDARWLVIHRGALRVVVNLAPGEQSVPVAATQLVLTTGPATVGEDAVLLGAQSAAIVRVS